MSIITPIKGKRVLPRLARCFDQQRTQILLTLIVACFMQLDVVIQAPRLDTLDDTQEIRDLEAQTQAFTTSVVQSILNVVGVAQMRLVTGLFGLLLEKDPLTIAMTRVRGPSHLLRVGLGIDMDLSSPVLHCSTCSVVE